MCKVSHHGLLLNYCEFVLKYLLSNFSADFEAMCAPLWERFRTVIRNLLRETSAFYSFVTNI
jgi:hypothetical protein